eukprot:6187189-Pleurochrysis_carterae.AAC.1
MGRLDKALVEGSLRGVLTGAATMAVAEGVTQQPGTSCEMSRMRKNASHNTKHALADLSICGTRPKASCKQSEMAAHDNTWTNLKF